MDSQVIAAIITGTFGLLTGIVVSKADAIQLNFLDGGRKLRKNWHGSVQRVPLGDEKCLLTSKNKCTMQLQQRGQRIKGEVQTEIRNSQGEVKIFRSSIKNGVLKGDYFFCDLVSKDRSINRIRKYLFYVHTSGEQMHGVFIGNRASSDRVVLGSCDMQSS